jgi:hypothetical protein
MFHGIFVAAQLELDLDGLFEALEAPVALLLLEGWYSQEFFDSLFGVVGLQLFGIVVFVLDVDIAALFFFVILIFEVVPRAC